MRLLLLPLGVAAVLWPALIAKAQVVAPQVPTTVQLPTFSFFTVQTTVSVPDSGGAYLGGIGRGADSSVSRSPLRNRALGSSRVASGVSVGATIIDHEEIDRAILAAATARRGETPDPAVLKAAAISKSISKTEVSALPDSVAAIRERNKAAADERASELADYFSKARQAEAEGKPGVAKIYYQMVARNASGEIQKEAAARLTALGGDRASANR